jgi:hypothetical protein
MTVTFLDIGVHAQAAYEALRRRGLPDDQIAHGILRLTRKDAPSRTVRDPGPSPAVEAELKILAWALIERTPRIDPALGVAVKLGLVTAELSGTGVPELISAALAADEIDQARALRLDETARRDHFLERGERFLAAKDFLSACSDASAALAVAPTHVAALLLRGASLEGLGDLDAARRDFEVAAALGPKGEPT